MVLDELTADISSADTVCNNTDAKVVAALTDGFSYKLDFLVNGVAQSRTNVQNGDTLTFATAGGIANDTIILQTVSYQTGLACATTINDTVTVVEQVVPAADIAINQNDIQVCSPNDVSFNVDITTGTGTVFVDYETAGAVYSGTVSGLAGTTVSAVVPGVAVGTYNFNITRVYTKASLTECDGTVGATTATATVRDNPQVSFVPNKLNVCDNENVTFKGSFTPGSNSVATQFEIVYEINGEGDQQVILEPGIGNDEIVISRVG